MAGVDKAPQGVLDRIQQGLDPYQAQQGVPAQVSIHPSWGQVPPGHIRALQGVINFTREGTADEKRTYEDFKKAMGGK